MTANEPKPGITIKDQAVAWLRERLPRGWSIESSSDNRSNPDQPAADAKISLRAPNGMATTIAVEERQSMPPRSVLGLLPRIQTARNMGAHLPLLVVAPWLSRRTQELLAEQDLSYIDLTGNALLRIDNPPFYLQAVGSERNPAPKERGQAQLRGAKAARLIRLLIDVRPPYGAGELATATNLAPGYVSRLLDTLHRETLIERPPRGAVETVDIAALIRRWASTYDVFRSNDATSLIASSGSKAFLKRVATTRPSEAQMVITGSFAASQMMAPVAAPALLIAYCDRPDMLAEKQGLLPAEEGANVILLAPFDQVVWERTSFHNRLTYAAPSQVVVDCLTGNGRMPAEGEALLDWMVNHEASWRASDLDQLPRR